MKINSETKYIIRLSLSEAALLEAGLNQWLEAHPVGFIYAGPPGLGGFMQRLYDELYGVGRRVYGKPLLVHDKSRTEDNGD